MSDSSTRIHIAEKPQQAAEAFAQYFAEWAKDKPLITLGLSGGSTPRVLFRLWAEQYRDSIDWSRIHFFWGDERCVPPGDEESNYKMANSLLLAPLGIPEEHVHRIRGEAEPEAEARRYAELLIEKVSSRNGFPSFDMLLLGMGADGHTASIFPNQMQLLETPAICGVAANPETGQQRITLTGKMLNNCSAAVFLVTGSDKSEKVKEILTGKAGSEQYPAAHVDPQEGSLQWYLDEAAAAGLMKG